MKLSKTSAHAALAVAYLSTRQEDGPVQARQIAEHLGIPTDSALKILQTLVRHKLIHSQLGRCGGYFLRIDPTAINLLQIVEAIDGPIVGDLPATSGSEQIESSVQVLATACNEAAQLLRTRLSRYTVADLAVADAPTFSVAV
jgi:Rrf2 family protein